MQTLSQDTADKLAAELSKLVRGRVLADAISRALYSTDASVYQILPAVVVLPQDAADVAAAVGLAARNRVSVGARGAGTGLAGECLTDGIVLDLSTCLNKIRTVAYTNVVVEPGVVLQQLNDRLAEAGKIFGPDPASGNRATIGGMIGTNATGAHSILYGHTSDHVRALETVLADGSVAKFYGDGRMEGVSPLAVSIRQRIPELFKQWAGQIEAHRPATARHRAGYGVHKALLPDGRINWCQLLTGSEGTLAVVTLAELSTVDAPKVKALVMANFDSLDAMARALPDIVSAGACTCELMDARLMEMARQAFPQTAHLLPNVAASLAIEVADVDQAKFQARLARVQAAVAVRDGLAGPPQVVEAAADVAAIQSVRTQAVPLLYRGRDRAKAVPCIEDVCVPVGKMPQYLAGLEKIAADEGVSLVYYAHAGDGELHIRPYLDLYEQKDRRRFHRISQRTFELAWGLGGSISGEHGCGLLRSGFLPQQCGPLYELLKLIKGTFDPDNILNPDRVITDKDSGTLMLTNLRHDHAPAAPERTETWFKPGEYVAELEACNGCGVCRSLERSARMCPVFKATLLEEATPRGKANILRHLASGFLPGKLADDPGFRRLAECCIGCRMCAVECPSGVNVGRLMSNARAGLVGRSELLWVELVLSRGESMGKLGSSLGMLANLAMHLPGARALMEHLAGVDRRRAMPRFAWGSSLGMLARRARRRRPKEPIAKVAYFVDMFGTYHDHALAKAVVDVLTHNDVEVIIPEQKSAAMPMIAYGDLPAARQVIRYNLHRLAPLAQAGVTILCSEPSAALCLKQEWLEIEHNESALAVSRQTVELTEFLAGLAKAGKLKMDFSRPMNIDMAYHAPCHLRALHGHFGDELVRLIPGAKVSRLALSCCGMAGTYGLQKRHYELSLAIGGPMLQAFARGSARMGVSECSTCRMQMESAGKPAIHPVKLLAAAYGFRVRGVTAALNAVPA